jgi:hypothetical protein
MTFPFRDIDPKTHDALSTLSNILADLESAAYGEELFNRTLDDHLQRAVYFIEAGTTSKDDAVLPNLKNLGGLLFRTGKAFEDVQESIKSVLENPGRYPVSLR